jgi:hypothetical protein
MIDRLQLTLRDEQQANTHMADQLAAAQSSALRQQDITEDNRATAERSSLRERQEHADDTRLMRENFERRIRDLQETHQREMDNAARRVAASQTRSEPPPHDPYDSMDDTNDNQSQSEQPILVPTPVAQVNIGPRSGDCPPLTRYGLFYPSSSGADLIRQIRGERPTPRDHDDGPPTGNLSVASLTLAQAPQPQTAAPQLAPPNLAPPMRTTSSFRPTSSTLSARKYQMLDVNPDLEQLGIENPFPSDTNQLPVLKNTLRGLIDALDQLRKYSRSQVTPRKDPNNPITEEAFKQKVANWHILQAALAKNQNQQMELCALVIAIEQGASRLTRGSNRFNLEVQLQARLEAEQARPVYDPLPLAPVRRAVPTQAQVAAARTLLQGIDTPDLATTQQPMHHAQAAVQAVHTGQPHVSFQMPPPDTNTTPQTTTMLAHPAFCPAQAAYLVNMGLPSHAISGTPAPPALPQQHPGVTLFPHTMLSQPQMPATPAATPQAFTAAQYLAAAAMPPTAVQPTPVTFPAIPSAPLTVAQQAYVAAFVPQTPTPASITPMATILPPAIPPPPPAVAPDNPSVVSGAISGGAIFPSICGNSSYERFIAALTHKLPPHTGPPLTSDQIDQRARIEGSLAMYMAPPDVFNNLPSENITEWMAELLDYMVATNVTKDMERVRTLKRYLGPTVKEQLIKVILPTDTQVWKPHLEYMLTHYIRNMTTERTQDIDKFKKRGQKPGESIPEFLQALKDLRMQGFPGDKNEIPFNESLSPGHRAIQDAFMERMTNRVLASHMDLYYIVQAHLNGKGLKDLEAYAVDMEPRLRAAVDEHEMIAVKNLQMADAQVSAIIPFQPGPPLLPTYDRKPKEFVRPNYPRADGAKRYDNSGKNPRTDPCWVCGEFGHLSYGCPQRKGGPVAAPPRTAAHRGTQHGRTGNAELDGMSIYKLRHRVEELEKALETARANADAAGIVKATWAESEAIMALNILWNKDSYQAEGLTNPDGTLN